MIGEEINLSFIFSDFSMAGMAKHLPVLPWYPATRQDNGWIRHCGLSSKSRF